MERPRWSVKRLNLTILATDGKSFRKVDWVTTNSGGIYVGIVSTPGLGMKLSYPTNGDLYARTTMTRELKERLIAPNHAIPSFGAR
jgi:hypothetical protein